MDDSVNVNITTMSNGRVKIEVYISQRGAANTLVDEKAVAKRAAEAYRAAGEALGPMEKAWGPEDKMPEVGL